MTNYRGICHSSYLQRKKTSEILVNPHFVFLRLFFLRPLYTHNTWHLTDEFPAVMSNILRQNKSTQIIVNPFLLCVHINHTFSHSVSNSVSYFILHTHWILFLTYIILYYNLFWSISQAIVFSSVRSYPSRSVILSHILILTRILSLFLIIFLTHILSFCPIVILSLILSLSISRSPFRSISLYLTVTRTVSCLYALTLPEHAKTP